MGRVFQFAIALLWASAMLPAAQAQTPPAAPPPVPDGPRYIVAYVDVRPAESVSAVKVLRALRDESRRAPGNLRSEALQRFGQLNQFVLLTVWKDQAAADARAKAAATAKLLAEIKTNPDRARRRAHALCSFRRPDGHEGRRIGHRGGDAMSMSFPRSGRTAPHSRSSLPTSVARRTATCASRP